MEILGSINDGPQQGTSSSFRFSVLVSPDQNTNENTPPFFLEDLPPLIEAINGKDEFTFDLELPEIFDAEGDNVEIQTDFAALTNYLKYDAGQQKIVPNRSSGANFDFVPVGSTVVSITLTDDNPFGTLSSFYNILVKVTAKPKSPLICPGDPDCPVIPPVKPCEEGDEDCPVQPPRPLVAADVGLISDITNTGDIVINLDDGFNLNNLVEASQQNS